MTKTIYDKQFKSRSSYTKSCTQSAETINWRMENCWDPSLRSRHYIPRTYFFEWIDGGAFLIMHSEIDEKEIPSGIAIFGSDDSTGEYFMFYFDERKVSRKYNVTVQDNILKWWRNAPDFSQRNTLTFSDNGNTIIGKGEMCKDGKTWEKDLALTYTRVK